MSLPAKVTQGDTLGVPAATKRPAGRGGTGAEDPDSTRSLVESTNPGLGGRTEKAAVVLEGLSATGRTVIKRSKLVNEARRTDAHRAPGLSLQTQRYLGYVSQNWMD